MTFNRRALFSSELHQSAAPFSHLVWVGDLGFVSGIIGQDRRTGELVSADATLQGEAMFDNLQILLGETGLDMSHLVRSTLYLSGYAHFSAANGIYERRLNYPYPARTTLQVAGLPLNAKMQIDAVVAFG